MHKINLNSLILHICFSSFIIFSLLGCESSISIGQLFGSSSNNTTASGPASVSVSNLTANEGDVFSFEVALSTPLDEDLDFDWATGTIDADPSTDYLERSGTETILAGETSATILIPSYSDDIDELTESFKLDVLSAGTADVLDTADASILNVGSYLKNVASVKMGGGHACALLDSGGVKCWGNNYYGQIGNDGTTGSGGSSYAPVFVSGLESGVSQIDLGSNHSCALLIDGTMKCWGDNAKGQIGSGDWNTINPVPADVSGLSGVAQVSAGYSFTCALLTNENVKCWGIGTEGRLGTGTATPYSTAPLDVSGLGVGSGAVEISSRGSHACAVLGNGAVKCWGYNFEGQLGDNSTTSRLAPVDVVDLGVGSGAIKVAVGSNHTCALLSGGTVKCWGKNEYGQIGNSATATSVATPDDVTGLSNVAQISAGVDHSCALLSSGAVSCWGRNHNGQLGNNNFEVDSSAPVDVTGMSSGVSEISSSGNNTCVSLNNGTAKCWGYNSYGQVANNIDGYKRTNPTDVIGLGGGVTQIITSRGYTTCALVSTGGVKCWGNNGYGQVGDGTRWNDRLSLTDVSGLTGEVSQIAAGYKFTCALLNEGGVKCWGYGGKGQSGDGTFTTFCLAPVSVVDLGVSATQITAGYEHACALLTGGTVKCWGDNAYGQLGNNDLPTDSATPVNVAELSGVSKIVATGGYHTCAVLNTGALKCWGRNDLGQLGNNSAPTSAPAPVDISGFLGSGVSDVGVSQSNTCALLNTGGVKCWGDNDYGQVGNSASGTDIVVPDDVTGLSSGVTKIVTGRYHSCALLDAGTMKCWGGNNFGQIGNGTLGTDLYTEPVNVPNLNHIAEITAGERNTCSRSSVGTVKCWGDNQYGQLGIGMSQSVPFPVSVIASE